MSGDKAELPGPRGGLGPVGGPVSQARMHYPGPTPVA
jgi:hypothetical protein